MKRENIMTTYKNLQMMHRSFELPKEANRVNPDIVSCAENHGKREAYLLNNRIFFSFINPSDARKEEYNTNWNYINSLP